MEVLENHPHLSADSIEGIKYIYEYDRYVFLIFYFFLSVFFFDHSGEKVITCTNRVVQCRLWGYPTEGAYYRDASSIDSLLSIRIPFLAINAEDDPVSRVLSVSVLILYG